MKDYKGLSAFAEAHGFTVTSAKTGKHNVGSKHCRGLAFDVRTRDRTDGEIEEFIKICRAKNLRVLDERQRPNAPKEKLGRVRRIKEMLKLFRRKTE